MNDLPDFIEQEREMAAVAPGVIKYWTERAMKAERERDQARGARDSYKAHRDQMKAQRDALRAALEEIRNATIMHSDTASHYIHSLAREALARLRGGS